MARIRTIKPEFFTSESILELEPLARLFFISLWCEADRAGRLAWKPKTLKYRYLPADNADIDKIADNLIQNDLIKIYSVDGKEYCQVTNFDNHQVINNREKESVIPSLSDASATRESSVKAEGRKEGKGKEGREGKELGAAEAAFCFKKSLINLGGDNELVETWLKVRKTKRAVNSEVALNGFIKQLEISRLPINDVLKECCENSWSGFKAEWLNNKKASSATFEQKAAIVQQGFLDDCIEGDYERQ